MLRTLILVDFCQIRAEIAKADSGRCWPFAVAEVQRQRECELVVQLGGQFAQTYPILRRFGVAHGGRLASFVRA